VGIKPKKMRLKAQFFVYVEKRITVSQIGINLLTIFVDKKKSDNTYEPLYLNCIYVIVGFNF